MEYHHAASEEFRDLRKRLLKELKKLYKISKLDRSPIFIRLLGKKLNSKLILWKLSIEILL
jgi:hypothetical protein